MADRVSRVAIDRCLRDLGVLPNQTFFTDIWYDCPTDAWLEETFALDLRPTLDAEGLRFNDGSESNDCDDFAFVAWDCARKLHRLTRQRNNGFAVGVFGYNREIDMVPHAINVGIVCDGFRADGWPQLRAVFFAPEELRVVKLTLQEIRNCVLYLF